MNKYSNNKKTYIKRENVSGVDIKKSFKSKLRSCNIKPIGDSIRIDIIESNWYSTMKNLKVK